MSKKNKNRLLKAQRRAEKKAANNRNREEQRFLEEMHQEAKVDLVSLPSILGANFNFEQNEIEAIRKKIESLPKDPSGHKKRILFISEAGYLKTGFSTYLYQVLKRLNATGKYEIAEFGSYGNSPEVDPRAKNSPWKYYHNMPVNNIEDAEYKKDYKENQFGKWKLSYVLADFKPDIILLNRDNWMDTHVLKNQFRGNCLVFWMPTVDGYPQKWEWLHDYSKVDGLYTYSWFGKKVLEDQSRTVLAKRIKLPELNVRNVMQPGVDTSVFKPMDKTEVKKTFGVPNNLRFIGTVMRNQPRKLFTRIIDSFRLFKEKYPIESRNTLLLLHTSIPDVGWDIPEAVRQNGLEELVVYSYMCSNCGLLAVSTFVGSPANCPQCNKPSFHTPNTQFGYKDEHFAFIYNLMDVYIQGSIAEGDGMPVNEAKACGVPVLCSDFSALYEKNRNGGGLPIKNDTIYTEHETMQWRSLFSREDLAEKLASLMGDEPKRLKLSKEARECAEKYYSWDLCATKWELAIDEAKIKNRTETWDKSIEIKETSKFAPPDSPNTKDGYKEWLTWCYQNILGRKGIDPDGLQYWTRVLENAPDKRKSKDDLEKHFRKMVDSENESKKILANPKSAISDPIQRIRDQVDMNDKFRILVAQPETAGDILIMTGVIDGLKKKYPEAAIYVATQPQFFNILDGNPQVKKVLEYHESMLNYRAYESFAMYEGIFHMLFNPYIITQRIPHWIHGGHGEWLGRCYADMCHVEYGNQWIGMDDSIYEKYPQLKEQDYITVHSQSRQDPKDYDYVEDAVKRIKNKLIVQVGGSRDKKLDIPNVLDLRGQTTPQQLASVLAFADMHFGMDSFPMHVAVLMQTPTVALFGGTYAKQGTNPKTAQFLHAIETQDRGPCVTSCHLSECEAKKRGFEKCINHITVDHVVEKIGEVIGIENIVQPEPIKISSYMIIKDGIKYGFPFEESIRAALKVSDEVVVVDGGSTDGTIRKLRDLELEFTEKPPMGVLVDKLQSKVKIYEHPWDMDNPTLFGDEKTYARQQCTGNWLIQLDADEIINEPKPGAIRELIKQHQNIELIDFPVINFYGNEDTTRIEENCWKWRISKNNPNIIHGVHGEARQFDAESMKITMDKKKSDGCEYIYSDSLKIVSHKAILPPSFAETHYKIFKTRNFPEYQAKYLSELANLIANYPVIFHYSWFDLNRKKNNGAFWDGTWHGKRTGTHNMTSDIEKRVNENSGGVGEIVVYTPINHPLRKTPLEIPEKASVNV